MYGFHIQSSSHSLAYHLVPNSSEDRWQRQQKTTEVKQTELVGKNMVFKKDGSVIAQIPFIFKTKYKYDVYMYMYLFIHILKGYH